MPFSVTELCEDVNWPMSHVTHTHPRRTARILMPGSPSSPERPDGSERPIIPNAIVKDGLNSLRTTSRNKVKLSLANYLLIRALKASEKREGLYQWLKAGAAAATLHSTADDTDTGTTAEAAKHANSFLGEWRNVHSSNLEAFLKKVGVSWAKRKVALAFKPEVAFSMGATGMLHLKMPSPIGDRHESFPLDRKVDDVDPLGRTFHRTARWDGATLETVARDPTGKVGDFVTRRSIREDGVLVQQTSHGGVTYERQFERKQRFNASGVSEVSV